MAQSGRDLLPHPMFATRRTAWCALALWLLGTTGAFWHFDLRDWRPFSSQSAQPFDLRLTGAVESWFRTDVDVDASRHRN